VRGTFPLVPRYRLAGLPFGAARSSRRGRGTDLAGSRPYVPGDPVSTIDWRLSARLSTARGDDEFLVRERYADEAPRVVVVLDRRPSMGLYPDWSPWLSKPAAVSAATRAIVESALAARAAAGYLDTAALSERPFWIPPRGRSPLELIEDRVAATPNDAEPGSLGRGIEYLARAAATLGAGSFVFVLSDFLDAPPGSVWLSAQARRWELVPVMIQDPTWEQSFPAVGPVILPLADPNGGRPLDVRLTRGEARAERDRRVRARAELLSGFASLGIDPVLVGQSGPDQVLRAFFDWAERRRMTLRRRR
jgi:uncharacterized protein (DUF58 family)